MLAALVSVSYTHLDVYKRQAELNTAFQAASAEMYAQSGAQGEMCIRDRNVPIYLRPYILFSPHTPNCSTTVSYTHLF